MHCQTRQVSFEQFFFLFFHMMHMHSKRKIDEANLSLENQPPIKKQRVVFAWARENQRKWQSTVRLVTLATPKLEQNEAKFPHLHAVGVFILRAQSHFADSVRICLAPPFTPLPTIESFYHQGGNPSISIFAIKHQDQQHTALCISALLQLYQASALWQMGIFSQLQPFLTHSTRQTFKKQLDCFVVDGLRSQDIVQTVARLALDLHPIVHRSMLIKLVEMWRQLESWDLFAKHVHGHVIDIRSRTLPFVGRDCAGVISSYLHCISWL
jgi:hypothetical protein